MLSTIVQFTSASDQDIRISASLISIFLPCFHLQALPFCCEASTGWMTLRHKKPRVLLRLAKQENLNTEGDTNFLQTYGEVQPEAQTLFFSLTNPWTTSKQWTNARAGRKASGQPNPLLVVQPQKAAQDHVSHFLTVITKGIDVVSSSFLHHVQLLLVKWLVSSKSATFPLCRLLPWHPNFSLWPYYAFHVCTECIICLLEGLRPPEHLSCLRDVHFEESSQSSEANL